MIDGEVELRDALHGRLRHLRPLRRRRLLRRPRRAGGELQGRRPDRPITDHYGNTLEEVRAPQDGIVLWVRRIRTVRPGDEVVIFGEVLGEIRP